MKKIIPIIILLALLGAVVFFTSITSELTIEEQANQEQAREATQENLEASDQSEEYIVDPSDMYTVEAASETATPSTLTQSEMTGIIFFIGIVV